MFLYPPHIAVNGFYRYFCAMSLADNIKAIREEKKLKQIGHAYRRGQVGVQQNRERFTGCNRRGASENGAAL